LSVSHVDERIDACEPDFLECGLQSTRKLAVTIHATDDRERDGDDVVGQPFRVNVDVGTGGRSAGRRRTGSTGALRRSSSNSELSELLLQLSGRQHGVDARCRPRSSDFSLADELFDVVCEIVDAASPRHNSPWQ
jgi:hypothetical protein